MIRNQSKNTLAEQIISNSQVIPGKFSDVQFKLINLLQTTLELEPLLDLFFDQLQQLIDIQSLDYTFEDKNVQLKLGTRSVHNAHYSLTTKQFFLGAITFTRKKRFSEPELAQIENLLGTLVYPLRNAMTYRDALHQAQTDPLTGLSNRGALEYGVEHEIQMAKRYDQELSMVVLDIDLFKNINDTHGHDIGDQVLKQVAKTLNATTRLTDLAYRFGGEEFVVTLGKTNTLGAAIIAERIRENIENMVVKTAEANITVTVSIGVSTLTPDMDSKVLFNQADKALYSAKKNGRNRVEIACLKTKAMSA